MFNCRWRENTSDLQFCTGRLPVKFTTDQQILLFYNRLSNSSNIVVQSPLRNKKNNFMAAIFAKHDNIPTISVSALATKIKDSVWQTAVVKAMNAG